jgi:hypothetical protein
MIETATMMASLGVLGYAFYISTRMAWVYKSSKGLWRWLYTLTSIFLIAVFFLFSIVMFSFAAASFISQSVFNVLNIVVGIFFISGSGLVGAIMKYQLSVTASAFERSMETDYEITEATKEILELSKEVEKLKKKAGSTRILKRMAVERELKIIELENKIKGLGDR